MNCYKNIELKKAILQEVKLPCTNTGTKFYMKRLDLIHPLINGNKWFKMKYNLLEAEEKGFNTLLTFGGAYSNHIHATAAAGKQFGLKTIGIIRGEEHLPLNPTLQFASEYGMTLHYVSRGEYRNKHTKEFQEKLINEFGNVYIVPEGGTNTLALKGCSGIPGLIENEYDYLCVACGTSGTFSGLAVGLDGGKHLLGFSVLKGGEFLIDQSNELIKQYNGKKYSNTQINLDYHFGGYAKITRGLIEFINEFEKLNGIPLDPVYTGKMMYGIYDLYRNGFFKEGEAIVALHTGGLQGTAGMQKKIKKVLEQPV